MLIKFRIASFRETDRMQESNPVYFGSKGITLGKVSKHKVWDYELTDTDGKVWSVYNQKKRGGFKEGHLVMTSIENPTSSRIGMRFTLSEFLHKIGDRIDWLKKEIKENELEIERLRAL